MDAISEYGNPDNLVRLVMLPAAFTGRPIYKHQRIQDAFVYFRKCSCLDWFIIITTTRKWTEILRSLYHQYQVSYECHYIVSRVFHLILNKLVYLLSRENFWCCGVIHFHVGWQKWGLPHAHILLWLGKNVMRNEVEAIIEWNYHVWKKIRFTLR